MYADHLQEQGDLRGEYLRLEVQLNAARRRMEELVPLLDQRWLRAVGRTWGVMLFSFQRTRLIETIKAVREVAQCGLKEAKDLVDRLSATGEPQLVVDGLDEARAEHALQVLRSAGATAEGTATRRVR